MKINVVMQIDIPLDGVGVNKALLSQTIAENINTACKVSNVTLRHVRVAVSDKDNIVVIKNYHTSNG